MNGATRLQWSLAAMVAGFALIGLSYLITSQVWAPLSLALFIVGTIAVIIFAGVIICKSLAALLR